MTEEIRVLIGKNGHITLQAGGAAGSKCLSLTESFERDLGRVSGRRRTGAYYETARIHHVQRTGCALDRKEPTDR